MNPFAGSDPHGGRRIPLFLIIMAAFFLQVPVYWAVYRLAPGAVGTTGVIPIVVVAMSSSIRTTMWAALCTLPWGALLAVTIGPGWEYLVSRIVITLLGTVIGVMIGVLISYNRVLYLRLKAESRRVMVLGGMLDVCPACCRIRAESGEWQEMEAYLSRHSEAEFSHSLCPGCAHRLEREVSREKNPAARKAGTTSTGRDLHGGQ